MGGHKESKTSVGLIHNSKPSPSLSRTQVRSGHHRTRTVIDQKPPSPWHKGVPVALARTAFTEETGISAHLIEKPVEQKMKLKREHNRDYPKEQHRETEKKKEYREKEQPKQKKKFQRLHRFGPHPIYMIPNGTKSLMKPWKT